MDTQSPPDCPRCGSAMRQRVARRGNRAGRPFWGCSDYPRCRGLVNIDERPDDANGPASNAKTLGPPVVSDEPQATEPAPGSLDTDVFDRRVSWADATTRRPGWVVQLPERWRLAALDTVDGDTACADPMLDCPARCSWRSHTWGYAPRRRAAKSFTTWACSTSRSRCRAGADSAGGPGSGDTPLAGAGRLEPGARPSPTISTG